MKKWTIIYLFIILLVLTTTKVNCRRGKILGGRSEVKDVKTNKEVQEVGKFSVQEYNRNPLRDVVSRDGGGDGPLRFIEVVEAQKQVVSGIKYYLKVAAMQNGLTRTFDAIVVVKPWLESKQLLNFGPSSTK
ncbi:cysteine proteinase inhibitor B-like [Silene latifolia]|uniref:cysteine proteinase inhibitor B-like n=1 Tax=Silene latifolia TaxID=37657 RepID=UPI003D7875E8